MLSSLLPPPLRNALQTVTLRTQIRRKILKEEKHETASSSSSSFTCHPPIKQAGRAVSYMQAPSPRSECIPHPLPLILLLSRVGGFFSWALPGGREAGHYCMFVQTAPDTSIAIQGQKKVPAQGRNRNCGGSPTGMCHFCTGADSTPEFGTFQPQFRVDLGVGCGAEFDPVHNSPELQEEPFGSDAILRDLIPSSLDSLPKIVWKTFLAFLFLSLHTECVRQEQQDLLFSGPPKRQKSVHAMEVRPFPGFCFV